MSVLPNGFAENGPQGFQTRAVVPNSDEEREIHERLALDLPLSNLTVTLGEIESVRQRVASISGRDIQSVCYRIMLSGNDSPLRWHTLCLAKDERTAALSAENAKLRADRDALAAELESLKPKADAKPVNNPFARRHDGRAPDRRE